MNTYARADPGQACPGSRSMIAGSWPRAVVSGHRRHLPVPSSAARLQRHVRRTRHTPVPFRIHPLS